MSELEPHECRTVAQYLRVCRKEAKKSQEDVAKMLRFKSPQFISNVERGLAMPPKPIAKQWSDFIGGDRERLWEIWMAELGNELAHALDLNEWDEMQDAKFEEGVANG